MYALHLSPSNGGERDSPLVPKYSLPNHPKQSLLRKMTNEHSRHALLLPVVFRSARFKINRRRFQDARLGKIDEKMQQELIQMEGGIRAISFSSSARFGAVFSLALDVM